ncbi:MAG TPA: endonuclease/exonuclease/phosphatase family protein [Cyclobacteriaceae bacterium]|nr:endonuclease/exonuclease/phosphatase family protein [Cyclobacteriaceae bacterium]
MRFSIVLFLFIACATGLSAQSVKVMTYNLRLDTPDDGVNQWPKRTDKVVALITKYNPDIIGVQEALHHQLQDLLRMLPDYSYCGVGRDDGKVQGEYSAILFRNSRFGLLDTKTNWLSETMDIPGSKSWDAAITRVFTTARFFDRQTKKEFIMVNTHFDHIGKTARFMSAMTIKSYLAGMQGGANLDNTGTRIEIPIIVSGDFNSEPTEESYKTMVNEEISLVFYDSRPASSTAGTFCGFKVGGMPCKTIDYIFHTKQWVARNYQVITDNDGTYYPSDHLPVMVDFDLALEK